MKCLVVEVAVLSEVRRPGRSSISLGWHTYYWSGWSDGHHLRGVAKDISSLLQSLLVEVSPVDDCKMVLGLKYAFDFVSYYFVRFY